MIVSGRPPQRSVGTRLEAEHAAAHQHEERRARTATHSTAQPRLPERADAAHDEQRRAAAMVAIAGPPLLVERIAAEDDEARTSRRPRPSRRRRRARPGRRRRRVATPRCSSAQFSERAAATSRRADADHARSPTALVQSPNRLRAQPGDGAGGATGAGRGAIGVKAAATAQRSLIAARAVVPVHERRGRQRRRQVHRMMIAMHSTARPVWFSAVLAIDTTSG